MVAGATRGAGRGIARALGEAGATVYCTGRSTAGRPATGARPETIEQTAERVDAAGGRGIAVRVDHSVEAEVEALVARIERDHGRLDLVVNDVWGGDELLDIGPPFWKQSPTKAWKMLERGVFTHMVTSRYAVPLMLRSGGGLLVEVTDGDGFGYRGSVGYDLAKVAVIRLAFAQAWELRRHETMTVVAVTPGFLRSEAMLDLFGVTEGNWRDGVAQDPNFIASESPLFVGRAVAALASDPAVHARSGRVFSAWQLAREYGFVDEDGSRPDWGEHFEKAYGRPSRVADEAAYESWREGAIDVAFPSLPNEE